MSQPVLEIFSVSLARDPLDVVGALCIAVSCAVFGSGFVARELGRATILLHLYEVQGTIHTTGKVRNVHIESELSVLEFELLVLRATCIEEIHSRADISACLESEVDSTILGLDSVRRSPIALGDTFNGAVAGTGYWVRTVAGVPGCP